jgi:FlaA1/EpsC-like NDP-sugar epimerase
VVSSEVQLYPDRTYSLTATLLRRRILSAMKTSQNDSVVTASRKVTQDFLYIYPTIERMASAIIGYATGQQHLQSTEEEIDALLAKYGKGMKTLANSGNPLPDQARVLLTGSTGSLGSHILVQLLQDERLAHLYAYNRPSKMGESSALRHENAFRDR